MAVPTPPWRLPPFPSLIELVSLMEPRHRLQAMHQWGVELRTLLRKPGMVALPCDCPVCGLEVTATDLLLAQRIGAQVLYPDVYDDPPQDPPGAPPPPPPPPPLTFNRHRSRSRSPLQRNPQWGHLRSGAQGGGVALPSSRGGVALPSARPSALPSSHLCVRRHLPSVSGSFMRSRRQSILQTGSLQLTAKVLLNTTSRRRRLSRHRNACLSVTSDNARPKRMT